MTHQPTIDIDRHVPLEALLAVYQDGDEIGWDLAFDQLWSTQPSLMDMLATSIQETGVTDPILLGNDGRIWDGHHRLAIAQQLGLETVPVKFAQRDVTTRANEEQIKDLANTLLAYSSATITDSKVQSSDFLGMARKAVEWFDALPAAKKENLEADEGSIFKSAKSHRASHGDLCQCAWVRQGLDASVDAKHSARETVRAIRDVPVDAAGFPTEVGATFTARFVRRGEDLHFRVVEPGLFESLLSGNTWLTSNIDSASIEDVRRADEGSGK